METPFVSIRVNPKAEVPMVVQIKDQITWLIATHQVQPGNMLPSVRELAKYLGVNINTTRMAYKRLEADALVKTQMGVGTVVLPFKTSDIPRQTNQMRSFTIGVLVPGLNPFFPPFLRGVREATQADPSLLFIANTEDSPQVASAAIAQLIAKQVDGLIVANMGRHVKEEMGQGSSGATPPIVYVDQPDLTGQHLLLYDSEGAAYQATRHLIEHGYQHIGLVTCPLEWSAVEPCYWGYRRALEEAKFEFDDAIIEISPAFTLYGGLEATERMLERTGDFDALFTVSDVLAIGALQAIKKRGLNIPEDVAITSYNDIEMAAFVDPPLTTVQAPAYEMGVQAMRLLQRLIAGEEIPPHTTTLATQLITRHSCGCSI